MNSKYIVTKLSLTKGLKRGEITTQHLYQQLANPALQHRHREMLLTILKIQNSTTTTPGYGPSPRVSPVPPHHHIFQQQQQQPQQLRVSPLPPNGESSFQGGFFVVENDIRLMYIHTISINIAHTSNHLRILVLTFYSLAVQTFSSFLCIENNFCLK